MGGSTSLVMENPKPREVKGVSARDVAAVRKSVAEAFSGFPEGLRKKDLDDVVEEHAAKVFKDPALSKLSMRDIKAVMACIFKSHAPLFEKYAAVWEDDEGGRDDEEKEGGGEKKAAGGEEDEEEGGEERAGAPSKKPAARQTRQKRQGKEAEEAPEAAEAPKKMGDGAPAGLLEKMPRADAPCAYRDDEGKRLYCNCVGGTVARPREETREEFLERVAQENPGIDRALAYGIARSNGALYLWEDDEDDSILKSSERKRLRDSYDRFVLRSPNASNRPAEPWAETRQAYLARVRSGVYKKPLEKVAAKAKEDGVFYLWPGATDEEPEPSPAARAPRSSRRYSAASEYVRDHGVFPPGTELCDMEKECHKMSNRLTHAKRKAGEDAAGIEERLRGMYAAKKRHLEEAGKRIQADAATRSERNLSKLRGAIAAVEKVFLEQDADMQEMAKYAQEFFGRPSES